MLMYMAVVQLRKRRAIDMRCVDTIARYLFYAFLIDFSLEMLDLIHRIYEADESFKSLDFMVHTRLYISQIVMQILLGTCVPIALLALDAGASASATGARARRSTSLAGVPDARSGIFAMRWNVVIGGQLFSKSFLGYTTYKMGFATREGLLPAIAADAAAVRSSCGCWCGCCRPGRKEREATQAAGVSDTGAAGARRDRRAVLDWLLGLSAIGALVAIVYPVYHFVFPPPRPRGKSKGAVLAARVDQCPPAAVSCSRSGRSRRS